MNNTEPSSCSRYNVWRELAEVGMQTTVGGEVVWGVIAKPHIDVSVQVIQFLRVRALYNGNRTITASITLVMIALIVLAVVSQIKNIARSSLTMVYPVSGLLLAQVRHR